MPGFDEDPLDLLEDDDDGVIEILTVLKEEEENQTQVRTGCLGLMAIITIPASLIYFGFSILPK